MQIFKKIHPKKNSTFFIQSCSALFLTQTVQARALIYDSCQKKILSNEIVKTEPIVNLIVSVKRGQDENILYFDSVNLLIFLSFTLWA